MSLVYFSDRRGRINALRLPKGQDRRADALRDGDKPGTLGELYPNANKPINLGKTKAGPAYLASFSFSSAFAAAVQLWNDSVDIPWIVDKISIGQGQAGIMNVASQIVKAPFDPDIDGTGPTFRSAIYEKWGGRESKAPEVKLQWRFFETVGPAEDTWTKNSYWRGKTLQDVLYEIYENTGRDEFILRPNKGLSLTIEPPAGTAHMSMVVELRETAWENLPLWVKEL